MSDEPVIVGHIRRALGLRVVVALAEHAAGQAEGQQGGEGEWREGPGSKVT